jgi:hypothetical protein
VIQSAWSSPVPIDAGDDRGSAIRRTALSSGSVQLSLLPISSGKSGNSRREYRGAILDFLATLFQNGHQKLSAKQAHPPTNQLTPTGRASKLKVRSSPNGSDRGFSFLGEDKMKKIAWLSLVVLGSMTLMHAQSSTTTMMSGTICRASCVVQQENRNTCDTSCTDKQGEAVLVDDQGTVHQIAKQSQPMCESHMNKHVKAKMQSVPSEQQREQEYRIMELSEQIVGG